MSAESAASSTVSFSPKSMARTVLLSSRRLKRPAGSLRDAPFGKVSRIAFLRASPMQMVTVAGPDGYPLRPGRLPPFYFFDNAGIGLPNYSANLRQLLPFPAGKIINDVIDFLWCWFFCHSTIIRNLSAPVDNQGREVKHFTTPSWSMSPVLGVGVAVGAGSW